MDYILHPATFVIDSLPDEKFQGFTADDCRWNGFAVPFFEQTEAERILACFEQDGYIWMYDSETDSYQLQTDEEFTETFNVFSCHVVERGALMLYGIGAYSWVWDIEE